MRVEFGSPDLLLHCVVEGDSHNQSCIRSSTNDGVRSSSAAIIWEVPSGIAEHKKLASVLTFISAVVGAFSIVFSFRVFRTQRFQTIIVCLRDHYIEAEGSQELKILVLDAFELWQHVLAILS